MSGTPSRNGSGIQNIQRVYDHGLCLQCGICVPACPKDNIVPIRDARHNLAFEIVNADRCRGCTVCLDVCPGESVDFARLNQQVFGRQPEDVYLGHVERCYVAAAVQDRIQAQRSSGGIVSTLLMSLLERRLIDGALLVRDGATPYDVEPFLARTPADVLSASRSKYTFVPVGLGFETLLREPGRYAVVGLPCFIHGVRKTLGVYKKLQDRVVLTIGLLCGWASSFEALEFIAARAGLPNLHGVRKIQTRGGRWPGHIEIELEDGRQLTVPGRLRDLTDHLFLPNRCATCTDQSAELADLSCGDAWLPEVVRRRNQGWSLVITRTTSGERIFREAIRDGWIKAAQIEPSRVIEAQKPLLAYKKRGAGARLLWARWMGQPVPEYRFGPVALLRFNLLDVLGAAILWSGTQCSRWRWYVRLILRAPLRLIAAYAYLVRQLVTHHDLRRRFLEKRVGWLFLRRVGETLLQPIERWAGVLRHRAACLKERCVLRLPVGLQRIILDGSGCGPLDMAAARRVCPLLADDPVAVTQTLSTTHAADLQTMMARAAQLSQGRFEFLGYDFAGPDGTGSHVEWQFDPFSPCRFPLIHWSRIILEGPQRVGGDIMFPNEPNKQQFLLTLAQAYFLTQDERYAERAATVWLRWIRENPVGVGVAYVSTLTVAQRVIAWSLALPYLVTSPAFSAEVVGTIRRALGAQAAFIERHLTTYWKPRNNFVLVESAALATVGTLCSGTRRARRWKRLGLALFVSEFERQTYADGVSIEHSVGYQRLVTEAACLVNQLAERPLAIAQRLERQLDMWLVLTQPDGHVPMIGDVSTERAWSWSPATDLTDVRSLIAWGALRFGRADWVAAIGTLPFETLWWVGRSGQQAYERMVGRPAEVRGRLFPDGGLAVLRSGMGREGHHLVMDCGSVGLGPRGPGGHGHNDALSITVCAFGQPFLVDPGTYIYFSQPDWRNVFRSVASHNTVTVDDQELSAVGPGLFTLRGPLIPAMLHWQADPDEQVVEASCRVSGHAPYEHRRRVMLIKEGGEWSWWLHDRIGGQGTHTVTARFHVAPGTAVSVEADGSVTLCAVHGERLHLVPEGLSDVRAVIEQGWYAPRYGVKVPAPVVIYRATVRLPMEWRWRLVPVRSDHPVRNGAGQSGKVLETVVGGVP